MQAWRVEVAVRPEHPDPAGDSAQKALQRAGLSGISRVRSRRGFLLGAELDQELGDELRSDRAHCPDGQRCALEPLHGSRLVACSAAAFLD